MYNIFMPTIIRKGNLRFVIYTNDHNPAHVHIIKGDKEAEAKFRIDSGKCIENNGFSKQAINKLSKLVIINQKALKEAWEEYHGEN
jgi:hypothetical protein